jgi:hypothetical protein
MPRRKRESPDAGRLTARVSVHRAFDGSTQARGNGYFDRGRVAQITRISDNFLHAQVRGSWTYELTIRFEPTTGALTLSCDCPVGERYSVPCKHLWALLRAVDADDALPNVRRAGHIHIELADPFELDPDFDNELDDDDELVDFEDERTDLPAAAAPSSIVRGQRRAVSTGRPTEHAANRTLLNDLIRRGAPGPSEPPVLSRSQPRRSFAALLDTERGADEPLELTILAKRGNGYVQVSAAELLQSAAPGLVEADLAFLALRDSGTRVLSARPVRSEPDDLCEVTLRDFEVRPILERLARAGSLVVATEEASVRKIAWEETTPKVCLTIRANRADASYDLQAQLSAGERHVDVESIPFVHASGVIIVDDTLMVLSTAEAQWLAVLRDHGRDELSFAPDELESFLERYYGTPDLPEIRLPPGLDLEPSTAKPERFVDIGASDGSSQGLPLVAGLRYDDKEVFILSRGQWVVDLARNVRYARDPELENAMRIELEALSVRLDRPSAIVGRAPDEPEVFRIGAKRVAELARALIESGWSVSVRRKPYRKIGAIHLRASSSATSEAPERPSSCAVMTSTPSWRRPSVIERATCSSM